jgi:divalent metal cation (Fe/Co/Zn/Cd) transporter
LRTVGHSVIGEASIAVSRSLRVEQAARIKDAVVAAVEAHSPRARITVTTEPRAIDDETVIERILLVAARRHLPVHHIIAQQIEERLSICLDLELDAAMPLRRAHELATQFENAIRDEFGADIEIDTHLEPLAPHILIGREADPVMRHAIADALAGYAAAHGDVHDVHDVRVRGTADGLVVNYHCRVDDPLTVEAAHEAVDAIERRLREEFPTILRVAGHSEPSEA